MKHLLEIYQKARDNLFFSVGLEKEISSLYIIEDFTKMGWQISNDSIIVYDQHNTQACVSYSIASNYLKYKNEEIVFIKLKDEYEVFFGIFDLTKENL